MLVGALLAGTATLVAGGAGAQTLDGTYIAVDANESVSMTLDEAPGGAVTGSMVDATTTVHLSGRLSGTQLSGTLTMDGEAVPFVATVQGTEIVFDLSAGDETERIVFKRTDAAHQAPGGARPSSVAPGAAPTARNVVINGKKLTDAELAQIERTYGVRLPDENFWYDRVLGAWGLKGGPTLGFTQPGLNLGGPLQADASGGGTLVFVNGRALHPNDLAALQQLTGAIAPGRYFITAQGLAGYEGRPVQWDLRAMMAQSQRGGGSNTWQSGITGASGFSDGETGAVFLPGGEIVSYGQ